MQSPLAVKQAFKDSFSTAPFCPTNLQLPLHSYSPHTLYILITYNSLCHLPLIRFTVILKRAERPPPPPPFKYCWEAWDTTCGHKAKDITPLIAWREEALDDLPWKDERGPSWNKHWNCFKGNVGKTSGRRSGVHNYGLFWAHRLHSSGAVWESRCPSWAVRPNEPSGFRGRKELLNRASALVTTCP